MSDTPKDKGHKTLAVKLPDDTHAQLQLIARLEDSTLAAEIQAAIEAHLEAKRSDPALSARAQAVLGDIEREAEARQQAIADLLSGPTKSTRAKKATGA